MAQIHPNYMTEPGNTIRRPNVYWVSAYWFLIQKSTDRLWGNWTESMHAEQDMSIQTEFVNQKIC